MLERLARKWADHVYKDSRSLLPSIIFTFNGLLFVLLYFSGIVASEVLLALGILVSFVGFHLFERAGLLILLDSKKRSTDCETDAR